MFIHDFSLGMKRNNRACGLGRDKSKILNLINLSNAQFPEHVIFAHLTSAVLSETGSSVYFYKIEKSIIYYWTIS